MPFEFNLQRYTVVIQTALPCKCAYVLTNPDGSVAARGEVEALVQVESS